MNYWYMYSDLKTKIQLCSSIISLTFSLIHISTLSTCSLNMRMSFSSTRPFPLLLEACRSSFHLELSLCKLCLTLSDSGCFFLSNTSPSYQKQFRSEKRFFPFYPVNQILCVYYYLASKKVLQAQAIKNNYRIFD